MNSSTLPNPRQSSASLLPGKFHFKSFAHGFMMPVIGMLMFLIVWHNVAQMINTPLGKFPGPVQVWQQAMALVDEDKAEHQRAVEFYTRQDARNAQILVANPNAHTETASYTGSPTFIGQIGTSLVTVLSGFLLASLIAIPLGISIGLNESVYAAFNPLIQLFKPVSPLAWLPLVTMVVSAVYVSNNPTFSKSFLNSMFTVVLCCLWPTVINTSVGVANVSKDLLNVSRVLQLSPFTHVFKIVLPSALPMIFTGLRLSLGIAWMVLIAAEMLAQNPGLGKFVWDQFQNGSSNSLGRIMVAVLVIGFIGFLLDRTMLLLQRIFSWDKNAVLR
jgi:nitrate/nitrite transport system permease protein